MALGECLSAALAPRLIARRNRVLIQKLNF
jgi:hypothetical protein